MDTIEERDGDLYIAMRDVLYGEPVEVTNFYALGFSAFPHRHLVGKQVGFKNGLWRDGVGTIYSLRDGANSRPSRPAERTPVPAPTQRGRKLETKWLHGRWHKNTRNGWKPA